MKPTPRRAAHAPALVLVLAVWTAWTGLAPPAALQALQKRPAPHRFAPPDEPAHYPPERQYELRHVRLELAFDLRRRTLAGTAVNSVVPLLSGTRSLVFHAAELAVSRVRLAGGVLAFSADPQAQTLTVRLDRAYGPGDRLDVAIDYSAQPRAGLYFVGPDEGYPGKPFQLFSQGEAELNRYWFPSWDEPDARATSELLATVERPYEVIGNGRLVEVLERPDRRRTFHWRMEQPHSTYLISVVAGEFSRLVDHWHGVPIESYVPPQLADRAPLAFGRTADMMDYFSTLTGRPYPYPKYAQVAVYDYMNGGQENITATTLTTSILRDRRAAADGSSEEVISHELAHQWFGDLITCRSWDHAWLNEGFASYFEAVYRARSGGEDEMALHLDHFRRIYFADDRGSYRRPIVTRRYPDADAMFDTVLYQKGALVLHMARYLMGEEGWWKGIREYVARHGGRTVTTQDLETALEEAAGVPLGALFDQYVYGAGHPELKARWEYQAATGMVRVSVRQAQKLDEQTGLFSFPLEIALVGEHGTKIERVPLRAEISQDLFVPSAAPPRTVVLDPRGALLAQQEVDKPDGEWIAQLEAGLPLPARLQAIRALGGGGSPEGVAALGRALSREPFHGTRSAATQALAEAAGPAALAALVGATADPDARSRAAVITALGKFPDHPELVARLIRALAEDDSYAVRAAAAGALGRFEKQRRQVAAPLLAALRQQSYRDSVQRAALGALARLDDPEGYAQAQRLVRYGNSPELRRGALHALGAYAARSRDAKRKEEARQAIESCLGDRDYLARLTAANALGELGDPASIPALVRSARNEVESRQRHSREETIREIEGQQAERRQAGGFEERLRQIEREQEVLDEELRQLRQAGARTGSAQTKAPAPAGAAAAGAEPAGGAPAGAEPGKANVRESPPPPSP